MRLGFHYRTENDEAKELVMAVWVEWVLRKDSMLCSEKVE